MISLKEKIRIYPDFPIPGISFVDLMFGIGDPAVFAATIEQLHRLYADYPATKVVGIDARGLIFGAPLALKFGAGFVPARKAHKLPGATVVETYHKEYGDDHIAIQSDIITPDDYVIIVDDIIATGGTAAAAERLVARFTNNIRHLFVTKIPELDGVKKLGYEYRILIE